MAFSKQRILTLFQKAILEDRLAHAYLLCGSSKEEVGIVSEEVSALILKCHLMHLPEHPDFYQLEPESKARKILIEQVRHLQEALHLKAQEDNSYKIALIHDADRMVPAAANAFLKTLEEPPEKTVLFLVTLLPQALLETVRSRCITIWIQEKEHAIENQYAKETRKILDQFFQKKEILGLTAAFQSARALEELLSQARKAALEEVEEEFENEKKRYAQATDGSWQEEHEERFRAAAELMALEVRSLLLTAIEDYLGAHLRKLYQAEGGESRHEKIASLLRALDVVQALGHFLEQGIQESLVLETGFIELAQALEGTSLLTLSSSR